MTTSNASATVPVHCEFNEESSAKVLYDYKADFGSEKLHIALVHAEDSEGLIGESDSHQGTDRSVEEARKHWENDHDKYVAEEACG